MTPLVSIITPCYNAASVIEQTIVSVLNQTYTNWELLICDDCSTDNSAEIIRKYVAMDDRVRYLTTTEPSGSPVKPRNIAIQEAKGGVIAFLDSDDVWLPTKLEEQIPLLKYSDTAIVYSNYEKINADGERAGRIIKAPLVTNYTNMLKGCVIGNLTGMYDVEKVGKIFCQDVHQEDYLLWLTILKQGYTARSTNTVTALYRVTGNSVSANKYKTAIWQWNILYNVEKLPFLTSVYCFISYAIKGILKAVK